MALTYTSVLARDAPLSGGLVVDTDAETAPRPDERPMSTGAKTTSPTEGVLSRVTTGVLSDLASIIAGSIMMCFFFKLQQKTTKKITPKTSKANRSEYKVPARPQSRAPVAPPAPSQAAIALTESFSAQVRQGNLSGATTALKELENEAKPSVQEYSAIISMCTKANDAETGHVWLERAKEMGVQPNSVCFNAVINAYVKRSDLKKAVALAMEMKACGVALDTVTYNTLIDGCARSGDAESAEWWMKTMLTAKVKPSVVTIGSMMLACAREGNGQRAMHWLETADSMGIVVNMICFSAVINAFAKKGDLETADHWLSVMQNRNVQPSIHCFTGMLEAALKALNIDRAAKIYESLRAAGVEPDAALFNWLVTASARAGDDVRAQAWADEASAAGFRLNRTARKFVNFESPAAQPVKNTEPQEPSYEDDVDIEERAKDLVGKRFVGTIKNYIHSKFGYIVCEETQAVFKRDVFLSSNDNPQEYGKGQRVSFMLFLDKKRNLPRAGDLEAASAKDPLLLERLET